MGGTNAAIVNETADRSRKKITDPLVVSKKVKTIFGMRCIQVALISPLTDKNFMTYYTNKLRSGNMRKGSVIKIRVKPSAELLSIAKTFVN
jgi:hypothetical protein